MVACSQECPNANVVKLANGNDVGFLMVKPSALSARPRAGTMLIQFSPLPALEDILPSTGGATSSREFYRGRAGGTRRRDDCNDEAVNQNSIRSADRNGKARPCSRNTSVSPGGRKRNVRSSRRQSAKDSKPQPQGGNSSSRVSSIDRTLLRSREVRRPVGKEHEEEWAELRGRRRGGRRGCRGGSHATKKVRHVVEV